VDETQAAPLPLAAPGTERAGEPYPTASLSFPEAIPICGVPTQLVVFAVLALASGQPILAGDGISIQFFATVSLLDTAVVALLIRLFLALSGESSRSVFLGRRPVLGEIWRGLALLPVVMFAVTAVVLSVRTMAPWTHTVKNNPFEAFMQTPLDAAIFIIVVVLAGGVREELQRAFILHRFEQRLGGIRVGLAVFSVTFGALHLVDQGVDVAIAVGLLGLFWGVMYMRRRSAILAMTNHAAFDAAQVAQALLVRAFGGV
jgi:membrane protease YdiL (CAAX protease family)